MMGMTTAGYSDPLLVDGRSVGGNEHVEFAESVGHGTAVKPGGEIANLGVDILHETDVTVVDGGGESKRAT